MSRPLSILATIFLFVAQIMLTERCSAERPATPVETATTAPHYAVLERTAEPEDASPRGEPRRPVWAGPLKWVFVVQKIAIPIADRVVFDRVRETGKAG